MAAAAAAAAQQLGLPSELVHTLSGHEGPVLNVRFNAKGTYCVSCGRVRGQQQLPPPQQPCCFQPPRALTSTRLGNRLARAHTQDRTLRLWNPHSGLSIKAYAGHGYEVRDTSVSSNNSQMASVGGDRAVFLWDVASGAVIRKFRGHDAAPINAVSAASSSGRWGAAGSSSRQQRDSACARMQLPSDCPAGAAALGMTPRHAPCCCCCCRVHMRTRRPARCAMAHQMRCW